MGALHNAKHELVAVARSEGKTMIASARAAGYEEMSVPNASKLCQRKDIKARVAELKERQAELADISQAWVLAQLKVKAECNLDDFFAHAADGRRLGIDLADVSRAKMAALEEVTVEEFTSGSGEDASPVRRTKIKPHSSVTAAVLIGKHIGMWSRPSRMEFTGKDGGPIELLDLSKLSDEQVGILEAIMRSASEPGSDSSGSGSPGSAAGGASAA